MKPYADTNVFSRFYLRLSESEEITGWLKEAQSEGSAPLPVTWLHRIETLNAFQLYVFAGKAGGQTWVTPERAAAAHAMFRADLAQPTFLRAVQIELPRLEGQFEELALRHSAKYGFRTYDLLHVASALLLACDTFWSFDPKASKLAFLEGLRVR
jgi:predicted nucleic acid-binding protein